MRFVVYGAGAIGGVVGGRLAQHGHEVVLVARGEHHDAIRDGGLRLATPDHETVTLSLPVVAHPADIDFHDDDVVLLAMKSQHTGDALGALAATAPPSVAVVSVQNGVANERAALRRFEDVYGVCVVCPALHLEPGVVEAHAAPVSGILDLGRFPHGVDARAERIADAFRSSTFESVARPDIMRWKYAKLLNNLGNAVDALCGPDPDARPLQQRARAEGAECLGAAGMGPRLPARRGHRRGDPRGRPRPPRRPLPVGWVGGPLPSGLVVVAEPRSRHGVDRGRLSQRRDRAARPAPRRADTGEPGPPTRGGAGGARGNDARERARRRVAPDGGGRGRLTTAAQLASASVSGVYRRPRASATAGLVTAPPAVFTPWARSGSWAVASTTPCVASATTYGKVALVSA